MLESSMKKYEVIEYNNIVLETDDSVEAYKLCNSMNKRYIFNRSDAFVRHNLVSVDKVLTITPEISAYRFWFKNGYAFYYLDHKTGVFQIYSDWGNYAYAWPAVCRGEEGLLDFIKSADKYYLTTKLVQDLYPDSRRIFNRDKTTAHVRYLICKARRDRSITAEIAQSLWEWVKNFKYDDYMDDDRGFYERLQENGAFCAYIESDVCDSLKYDTSPAILFLQESLIPFFHRFCKDKQY